MVGRHPAPSTRHCCAAQRLRTLTEAHTSRLRNVFRDTPENVGRQSRGRAASGHGSRRCAAAAAGDSPLTQGGNASLFDGGKGGGHRGADSRCATARPPASHRSRRAGKQPEGTCTTEKGRRPAVQTNRTRTTIQAPTTQPALLAADAFVAALGALPADDWSRTWAAGRTIMLRRTSKRVKEVVDKMRMPAIVRLRRSFWDAAPQAKQIMAPHKQHKYWGPMSPQCTQDCRACCSQVKDQEHPPCKIEKRLFVLRQLTAMTARCSITKSNCAAVTLQDHTLQDHMQSGLQDECWRSAERWCTLISVKISSDRGRDFCWSAWAVLIAGSPQSQPQSDRRCWGRESCKSAGAVHSAGSPRSQQQCDRSCKSRDACRSAAAVPRAVSPQSQRQCDRRSRGSEPCRSAGAVPTAGSPRSRDGHAPSRGQCRDGPATCVAGPQSPS